MGTGPGKPLDSVTYGNQSTPICSTMQMDTHDYNPGTSPVTFEWTLGATSLSGELPRQIEALKAANENPGEPCCAT